MKDQLLYILAFKTAIRSSLERDPVDAIRDAGDLVAILKERCDL